MEKWLLSWLREVQQKPLLFSQVYTSFLSPGALLSLRWVQLCVVVVWDTAVLELILFVGRGIVNWLILFHGIYHVSHNSLSFSNLSQRVNYTLTLTSSDTNDLNHPLISAPNQGVLPTTPYRMLHQCFIHTLSYNCLGLFTIGFHVCFPCLSESTTTTIVTVTLIMTRASGEQYCPIEFFIAKTCNARSRSKCAST